MNATQTSIAEATRKYERTKRQATRMVHAIIDEYPRLDGFIYPDFFSGSFLISLRGTMSSRAWMEYNSTDHTDWSFRWYNMELPNLGSAMSTGCKRLRLDTSTDHRLNVPNPYGLEIRNGYLWTTAADKIVLMTDHHMNGINFDIDLWKIGTVLSQIHDRYTDIRT